MKLLLENWRKHLNEGFGAIGTVEDLYILMRAGREEENKTALRQLGAALGKTFLSFLPNTEGVAIGGVLGDYYRSERARQGAGSPPSDDPKQHPILDLFDMDPMYMQFIRKDWLLGIDELYEEYLDTLSPGDSISKVMDINDFINERIHRESQGVITITNQSADWEDPWKPEI
tara:strand:- start:44 stop:562 length:519 start_codon:yes stop_codon:yes gene_type:complete